MRLLGIAVVIIWCWAMLLCLKDVVAAVDMRNEVIAPSQHTTTLKQIIEKV